VTFLSPGLHSTQFDWSWIKVPATTFRRILRNSSQKGVNIYHKEAKLTHCSFLFFEGIIFINCPGFSFTLPTIRPIISSELDFNWVHQADLTLNLITFVSDHCLSQTSQGIFKDWLDRLHTKLQRRFLGAMTSTAVEPPSERARPAIIRPMSSRSRAHPEQHSEHGDVIRDIIIGFADGLTVPFALTAGLSSYATRHVLLPHAVR
jgi:hypothetical protein